MIGIGVIHVGVGPVPQGVESFLLIHLDSDHHAVGHAFGADVGVLDVGDVGQRAVVVCSGGDEEALGFEVAFKELFVSLVNFGFDLGVGFADFGEEVSVFAGGEGAFAVVKGDGVGGLGGQGRRGQ